MNEPHITFSDVWARVTRALEALEDGDVFFAFEILRDLDKDLSDELWSLTRA